MYEKKKNNPQDSVNEDERLGNGKNSLQYGLVQNFWLINFSRLQNLTLAHFQCSLILFISPSQFCWKQKSIVKIDTFEFWTRPKIPWKRKTKRIIETAKTVYKWRKKTNCRYHAKKNGAVREKKSYQRHSFPPPFSKSFLPGVMYTLDSGWENEKKKHTHSTERLRTEINRIFLNLFFFQY